MIYLDYAAATPVDPRVQAAMQPFWDEQFYNPSALYMAGREVAQLLDQARADVALCLGARPSEIIFTAGGTEADNLAIHGVMQTYPQAKLLVSGVEHDAVLEVAQQYHADIIPVTKTGLVDLEALRQQLDDQVVLVSVMYANNELGTIQPLKQIAALIKQVRTARQKAGNDLPLYLHTDASQAGNYLDLHVSRLGVDLMTLNGGKIYGPKQTGGLFVKSGIVLQPQVRGGGQERGLRSGTENVAGSVGFATALRLAQADRQQEGRRLRALRDQFVDELCTVIPAIDVNGDKQSLPNIVHITIPGVDNERVMMQLDEKGILCAVGSACSASHDEPSHVLKAIGMSDAEARSSLRFSMGSGTTQKDLKTVVGILQQLVV